MTTTTRETLNLQRIWSDAIRAEAKHGDSYFIRIAVEAANTSGAMFGTVAWYAAAVWHYNQV